MEATRSTSHHGDEGNKARFQGFLSTFTLLAINIPLVEALNKMPTYAKLMNELVNKMRALDYEAIEISQSFSAFLTR